MKIKLFKPLLIPSVWTSLLGIDNFDGLAAHPERAREKIDRPDHALDPSPYRDDYRTVHLSDRGYDFYLSLASGDNNYWLNYSVFKGEEKLHDDSDDGCPLSFLPSGPGEYPLVNGDTISLHIRAVECSDMSDLIFDLQKLSVASESYPGHEITFYRNWQPHALVVRFKNLVIDGKCKLDDGAACLLEDLLEEVAQGVDNANVFEGDSSGEIRRLSAYSKNGTGSLGLVFQLGQGKEYPTLLAREASLELLEFLTRTSNRPRATLAPMSFGL